MRAVLVVASGLVACGPLFPRRDAGPEPQPDASVEDAGADAGSDAGSCSAPFDGGAIDCANGGCPALAVSGDPYASLASSGNFRGYADSALMSDPATPGRVWLGYSWLSGYFATGLDGGNMGIGQVASHLARSDDDGRSFTFVRDLYPATPVTDPEGSGERGLDNSETVSLARLGQGSATVWYATHLRYFQRPLSGYHPKFSTAWTVRIGAAASPPALGDAATVAAETVLGVTATASVYQPAQRLDQLAGIPQTRCAMLNNPALFAENGTLYLVVECLAFVGQTLDFANTTTQVFATSASGTPRTWVWRHAGKLADVSLAAELGSDTVQQFDLSRGADGALLMVVSPANADASAVVGTISEGCAAIELISLDPPVIRRDCDGRAIVRARVKGRGPGSCSYHPASATGLLAHQQLPGVPFSLLESGLRP